MVVAGTVGEGEAILKISKTNRKCAILTQLNNRGIPNVPAVIDSGYLQQDRYVLDSYKATSI